MKNKQFMAEGFALWRCYAA